MSIINTTLKPFKATGLTLPLRNVPLAEWFSASKENGNEEDGAERVNDFAAPGVMNLLRRVLSFSGWWSAMVVG